MQEGGEVEAGRGDVRGGKGTTQGKGAMQREGVK